MTSRSILLRMFIAAWLVIGLLPGPVRAAPRDSAPLPLPDLVFYGTVQRNGVSITSGTVSVVLPRGGVISAPIGPIAGTAYTYALVVPLSQYRPDTVNYAANSAVVTDTLRFFIDSTPATFIDAQGFARAELVLPGAGAIGQTYVLNLDTAGAEAYFLGDVNANGRRDAADALLVMRYDVGLITGVTTFPPGPHTLYLPLCDIISDGQCNSSDALRILRCDAGLLSGADCPLGDTTQAALLTPDRTVASTEAANLDLRVTLSAGAVPDQVVAQVLADDWQFQLGAVSLDVVYDAQQFTPLACLDAVDEQLSAATCNVAFRPGVVRLNAATTQRVGPGTVLRQITFRRVTTDPAATLSLAVNGVFNRDGDALAWHLGDGSPRYRTYLPLVVRTDAEVLNNP